MLSASAPWDRSCCLRRGFWCCWRSARLRSSRQQSAQRRALVVHTVEVEGQITLCCSGYGGPRARAGLSADLAAGFSARYEAAVAEPSELDKLTRAHQRQSRPGRLSRKMRAAVENRIGEFAREMNLVKKGIPKAPPDSFARSRRPTPCDTSRYRAGDAGRGRPAICDRTATADRTQQLASIDGHRIGPRDRAGRHRDLPGAAFVARRDQADDSCATVISTSRPRSTSVPRTCAKPMTRSSASPTSSATICARRW